MPVLSLLNTGLRLQGVFGECLSLAFHQFCKLMLCRYTS